MVDEMYDWKYTPLCIIGLGRTPNREYNKAALRMAQCLLSLGSGTRYLGGLRTFSIPLILHLIPGLMTHSQISSGRSPVKASLSTSLVTSLCRGSACVDPLNDSACIAGHFSGPQPSLAAQKVVCRLFFSLPESTPSVWDILFCPFQHPGRPPEAQSSTSRPLAPESLLQTSPFTLLGFPDRPRLESLVLAPAPHSNH